MKILFLVDPRLNYVSDPIYVGLLRTLGAGSVIDYPRKSAFHDPAAKLWFLPQVDEQAYSEEKIRALLADKFFDIVCVASPRPESLATLARLYTPDRFPPIVFIDSGDDTSIRHDVVQRYPLAVYFKRDYIWKMGGKLHDLGALAWTFRGDRNLYERTFPLPLSIVIDTLPNLEPAKKEIDVSYRGRASHRRRAQAIEIISRIQGVTFSGGIYASPDDRSYKMKAGRLERLWSKIRENGPASHADQAKKQLPEAYYQEIAASKIALALRGGGRTASLRYFEIVAMGTMLLSDAPETVIPDDFVDRRHAVYCRGNLSNLTSLVRYYLEHDREREAIAAEGKAHLLKHHTCERRAEYFLNICARSL